MGDGRPIGNTRKSWKTACENAGLPATTTLHDFRRSAYRNMRLAGVDSETAVAMRKRYAVVDETEIGQGLDRVQAANQARAALAAKTVSLSEAKQTRKARPG